MRARKLVLPVIVICCLLVGLLVWACVPALAATGFAFSSSFAAPAGGFEGPAGVAVDNSTGSSKGSVYVADQGHSAVDKYSEAGSLQPESAEEPGAILSQITVDDYAGSSEGDVYAAGYASGIVYRFTSGLLLAGEIKGLDEPTGVAVDQVGDVFVSEYAANRQDGRVFEFNAAGEPISASGALNFAPAVVEGLENPEAVAVSANGEQLYVASARGTLQYTISGSTYAQSATIDPDSSTGVTLTPSGNVLVDQGNEAIEYEPSGTVLARFGGGVDSVLSGAAYGIAAGQHHTYIADRADNAVDVFEEGITPETPVTTGVKEVKSVSAILEGELKAGGGGVSGYYFQYSTGPTCEASDTTGSPTVVSGHTTPQAGTSGGVQSEATELQPHTRYTFCLVATKYGSTVGPALSFETPSVPPKVEGESFSQVGSNSAVVSAQVTMQNSEGSYYYEYEGAGGQPQMTSEEILPAGNSQIAAPMQITGLSPTSEYRFRIVVKNSEGETSEGAAASFTTLPQGILGLPDGRVYEMVTPVGKEDAEVYVPQAVEPNNQAEGYQTTRLTEAAANGNAIVFQADPTHNGAAGAGGNGLGSAYLAKRSLDGSWTQASIQPPGRRYTEYRGFSRDLSVGILMSITEDPEYEEPQLLGAKAPAGYYTGGRFEEREDLYRHSLSEEDYQPLFTAMPSRTSPETSGNAPDSGSGKEEYHPVYADSSTDTGQVLFEVNDDALLEGGGVLEKELGEDVKQEITNGQKKFDYLYDWSGGRPSLVDVLPDGSVAPNSTFGSPHMLNVQASGNPPDFSHVISSDGSHVFWSTLEGSGRNQTPKALYVRENATRPQSPLNGQDECADPADACTIQLDEALGGGGRFWSASSDGSKAFFTKGGLYEYRFSPNPSQSGVLTDLTPGVEVQGVLGTSEDGDYIYYVDSAGKLYMLHENDSGWEAPVSIASLSPQDGGEMQPFESLDNLHTNNNGYAGDWVPDIGQRTAEVTPDGKGLVFMSYEGIKAQGFPKGYEDGGEEVYLYDAAQNRLFCASCSQSGEAGSEGFLPISWSDSYIPTLISESGDRVFFDSGSPLVGRDTNGKMDVYEWEREGAGSCGQGEGARGGCVYLLSGGTSNEPSWLLGASTSGSDVFMITRADLTADAQDELYKVFDARVGGVEPLAPPACTGTGCQGVPGAPPTFATPASVTYDGVGNFPAPGPAGPLVKPRSKSLTRAEKFANALKACRGKPKKKRASCEALARRRYGPFEGKAKKSSKAADGSSSSKRGSK